MIYIGIDPGKKGGVAIISDKKTEAYAYSDEVLIELMKSIKDKEVVVCLEYVHSMPKQGVVSTFSFGKSAGFIEGVLQAFSIPYQLIRPQRWKAEFSLTGSKQKSVDVCRKLFPKVNLLATERSRVPHDGMAEALLMAEYAKRKL